ncbi:MAG: 4-hydroxy-tetrahydrodipicolinate synthase [Holosporales bacterium]|jgi:4-hydroxy-tetrahydrodipicolinate synthase|nr:4-hydroxy-tetrahydrodipicolinate synthase [Holosporales bacterium]
MFAGSMVALVTPFCNNLIDRVALGNLIEKQISSGINSILVCGTTGEGTLLSAEERKEVILRAIEVSNGRAPVVVGCSAHRTSDAINLIKQAEELEADGVLVSTPYYVIPTQEGIFNHFAKIHENTDIPIIMYNNPTRCSVNMSVEIILRLAKLERIVGLKDSNTDLSRVSLIREKNRELVLLSGDDASIVGYLANGGDGAVSVVANVAPTFVKVLVSAWRVENVKMMQKVSFRLAPFNEVLFLEPNPILVKYILSKIGGIQNELRPPLTEASKAMMDLLDKELPVKDFY